jgi:hypothetical protein
LIIAGLAGQAGGANPPAALAAATGFVFNTGLAVELISATRTSNFQRLFQNLQIIGGGNVPHGLARDRDAILEDLFAAGHIQGCARHRKAALDPGGSVYAPFIAHGFVPDQSPVLQFYFFKRF